MKYYVLSARHKKSVDEIEIHRDTDLGASIVFSTNWRNGEFLISVPETREEIEECLAFIDPDMTMEDYDEFGYVFLPDEDEQYIELDDYCYELLGTFDACSEDYQMNNDTFPEIEAILEEYGSGALEHKELQGFEHQMSYYEIWGGVVLQECDKHGRIHGTPFEGK